MSRVTHPAKVWKHLRAAGFKSRSLHDVSSELKDNNGAQEAGTNNNMEYEINDGMETVSLVCATHIPAAFFIPISGWFLDYKHMRCSLGYCEGLATVIWPMGMVAKRLPCIRSTTTVDS